MVDLPAPFGPRKPNTRPFGTSKETPRTASTRFRQNPWWKVFASFSTRITLSDTCSKIYGETYANLHMRDCWNVYDEYKDVYPLGEKEGELRKTLKNTFCGSLPQEHVKSWFEEWKKWSLNSTEKD